MHVLILISLATIRLTFAFSARRQGKPANQLPPIKMLDSSTLRDVTQAYIPQHSLTLASSSDLSVQLYNMQLGFSGMVERELSSLTPVSFGLLYVAGLLTALSPCSVSLLPLTLAYLGTNEVEDGDIGKIGAVEKSVYYAAGFALALTGLGLAATLGGRLFGLAFDSVGISSDVSSFFTASLTVVMGLSLLEVLSIPFPSLPDDSALTSGTSERLQPVLLGGSAALIASPCASPVLASLLAALATKSESSSPAFSFALLLAYSTGYTSPIVFAGAVSDKLNSISRDNGFEWVNYVLGMGLVGFGTYGVLESAVRSYFYAIA